MAHTLVIANETAASATLIDVLKHEAAAADDFVTVISPVNEPRQGYVVYEDTRRAAAGRRLDKTLRLLRESGVHSQGFVVDCGPVQAVRDALAQLEPVVDRIVVSTHPPERSGWMRRDVVEDIRRLADDREVEHVIAADEGETAANVLVIANQTVISDELLERVRRRAQKGPVTFLIVAPQSDDADHPEADRRLRRALSALRGEGIEAHGQIVHPDPFTAAMHATQDERVDEIIVSTFPGQKSGWLRRDLVGRLRKETGLPVEHVVASS